MKRLDVLAAMLTLPFALLGGKNIARVYGDSDALRSETLPGEAGFVNALAYGLHEGGGHGEQNAAALQRAVDDLALVGGTMLIPTGYYEIASPISLAVTTAARCTKAVIIVGGERAILSTSGDIVFATTISDDARLSRVEIRGLQLQGNLGEKMPGHS